MIVSYLSNRRQRVKISGEVSNWSTINRGVPQGSVLGPLLFNLFLNDLFFVKLSGKIANYADDNHLYNKNECIENLKIDLMNDANAAVTWFHENHMVTNSDKFQCIMLSRNGGVSIPLSVHNNILYLTDEIKVLGVTLDDSLNFKSHVTDIFFLIFLFQIYLYRVNHSVTLFFHGTLLQSKTHKHKNTYIHIHKYKSYIKASIS